MTRTPEQDSFTLRLDRLRRSYAAQLPQRLREIASELEALLSGGQRQSLEPLREKVHRLAGSSGSYGLPAVSREARSLELALGEVPEQELPAPAAELLRRHLRALEAAVREQRQEPETPAVLETEIDTGESGGGERDESLVVLVGEAPESREDLGSLLESSGYRLRHFQDAEELHAMADEPLPAAVLVDLESLPAARIGSAASGAAPPTLEGAPPQIVFSSEEGIEARLRAVRAGSAAFLTEPLDPELLIETLDRLIVRASPSPFRILIVDDDRAASAQTALYLRQRGMQVAEVSDPLAVFTPLLELQPDLILMDLHMPGCSGMELAAVIRQLDSKMRVPIVFLSAESDPATRFGDMLRVGEDVLDKSMKRRHMVLAVANHARRSRLLRSLMTRDSLTGLLSHGLLMERLDQELGRARREGESLAFAMADLDGFKGVNDKHGHRAGDRVLRSFGRFVRRELGGTELVGRYGGDEFGIVLPGLEAAEAVAVLERARRLFAAIQHPTPKGGVKVTLSMGVADFPRHGELSTLTRAADLALYQAKDTGRDRVALAP